MIVLGVETSGRVGSLALRRDGHCVEERFLPELGRRHAQSLVPEAAALLRRYGISPAEVDAVAVAIGPGSFTGLRVGAAFAKTFAYATGAKLLPVETFLAIAANTPAAPAIAVVADAQRGGVIFGRYVRSADGRFSRAGELRLILPEEVSTHVEPGDLLTGPGVERLAGILDAEFATERLRLPRASAVAALGDSATGDQTADPRTLDPLYVRKSGAEEKRDASDAAGK